MALDSADGLGADTAVECGGDEVEKGALRLRRGPARGAMSVEDGVDVADVKRRAGAEPARARHSKGAEGNVGVRVDVEGSDKFCDLHGLRFGGESAGGGLRAERLGRGAARRLLSQDVGRGCARYVDEGRVVRKRLWFWSRDDGDVAFCCFIGERCRSHAIGIEGVTSGSTKRVGDGRASRDGSVPLL